MIETIVISLGVVLVGLLIVGAVMAVRRAKKKNKYDPNKLYPHW